MIIVKRGAEPQELPKVRVEQLAKLRKLPQPPQSKEIEGYRFVSAELWRAQNFKCCYCERFIPEKYNDVEHYRPKASASRLPGCVKRHGYWWLAFDWTNLLFACPGCNRTNKNDAFPLTLGSTSLVAEEATPGAEAPLLIDPAGGINPVLHLEFYPLRNKVASEWWVRGRNGSALGQATVITLSLNAMEYREMRSRYFEVYVAPAAEQLNTALISGNTGRIEDAVSRAHSLLNPKASYVALASDALRCLVPDARLLEVGAPMWPALNTIGIR